MSFAGDDEGEPLKASWFDECEIADTEAFSTVDLFIQPEEVRARIEAAVAGMLAAPAPHLAVTACGAANAAQGVRGALRLGKQQQVVGKAANGAKKLARMLEVLAFVHEMLHRGRHATQRDIYYCLVNSFGSQAELNQSIQDCVRLLGCSRLAMNISTTSRGFVAGLLRWRDGPAGEWVSGVDVGAQGLAVPGFLSPTLEVDVAGRYVVVVEKDCVFQQLCAARLWEHVPCVIVTGCGFPDCNTRVLCHLMTQQSPPPVPVGLVDFNPAGVAILMTYRCGSRSMGLEMHRYALPHLRWLGVHGGDVAALRGEPLTARDAAQKATLLGGGSSALPPAWRGQVERMTQKVEIQAVYNSFNAAQNVAAIAERIVQRRYL